MRLNKNIKLTVLVLVYAEILLKITYVLKTRFLSQ